MKPEDLKIEAICPVRPGGQSVGVVDTGVKITHIPTGLSAYCGTERSQQKNKKIAMAMLEWGLAEVGWRDPL